MTPSGKQTSKDEFEVIPRESGKITGFWFRLQRAIQRHGVFGAFKVAMGQVMGLANKLRPAVRAEILRGEQRALEFDQRFGVDTAGCIHPTALTLHHPNQVHAVSYGASDPEDFRSTVASLPIDYSEFSFVDFGSGKGRVILLASEFPFKRIVGVEFSEQLHKIAQVNINNFSRNAGCYVNMGNVESICMDAVDFPLPDGDLICYFCNPFDATIMTRVVANIRESLLHKPRNIFILYYNAKEGHLFDHEDCFRRVETSGWICIWRTTPQSKHTEERSEC